MKSKEAQAGDIVRIKTDSEEYEGTIIESYDPNIILIKLKSGYNLGIKKKDVKKIEKKGKAEQKSFPEAELKNERSNKLPGISIIITGGTISSRIDYATGGVKWLMKPEELFALAPKVHDIAKINAIEKPFMIASENMTPENWKQIAKTAEKLLNDEKNKGIIITHGTDTLHYTAAALSFMLKNLNKPVILTYAQRSTDRGSTDTSLNLTCAAAAAVSDIAEVMIVGHASENDDFCYAIRGTKARKMHSSRRDAFRPINDLPIAKISEDGKIEIMDKIAKINKRNEKKVTADTAFEDKITLVKFYPGAKSDIIDFYIKQGYKGIVIEATGLGHIATEESKNNWLPSIKTAIDAGILVCITTQTIYGRVDPYVYTPGRKLLEAGALYLGDMLSETAYVKLGWVLGHAKGEEAKKLMLQNLAGELNEKVSENAFLF
jgi:glutamyl-tRNA(Gln) amidotransferase subunit D